MLRDNAKKVELLKYLPFFMQKYKEMQAIMKCENPVVQDEWSQLKQAFKNGFIFSTDVRGITLFEEMMEIYPPAGSTLADRKLAVYIKWNTTIPYTWRWLLNFLETYFSNSDTSWNAVLKPNTYELDIELTKDGNFTDLEYALYPYLRKVIPANLVLRTIDKKEEAGNIYYGAFLEEIITERIN